VAVFMVVLSCL